MQLTSLSLALTRAGFLSFSPASLFAAGEPGVWYEPSLTNGTCFQDSSGTTPVTAVEQPVGLMLDKSKGLVLGPELVTNGDFSNGTTNWIVGTGGTGSVSDGDWFVNTTSSFVLFTYNPAIVTVAGRTYKATIRVKSTTAGFSGNIRVGTFSSGQDLYNGNGTLSSGARVYEFVFTATTSTTYLWMQTGPATGQIVIDNISVRELPGNHAFQTVSASRPVLSARVNLLTKTEQFDDAAWVKNNATVTANTAVAPDGTTTADKFIPSAGAGGATCSQSISVAATQYTYTFRAKAEEQSTVSLISNLTGAFRANVFNLSAQTVSPGTGWTASITQDPGGNGWFICSCSATADIAASKSFQISNNTAGWTGDGTSGIYIWGASLVPANQASLPYQRVNTATDYDTTGFPLYLRCDGVDDGMVTNTITPGTDKAQVFAGVRKLSDATTNTFFELGPNSGTTAGTFGLFAAINGYRFRTGGSILLDPSVYSGYPVPIANVLTGIGDISGDSAILRVNGTQAASSTADQGTGNYLAYPLYIGRRGGTTLPFNGHIYSMIVRFGANLPAATIANTEAWVNGKTKAY